jgi:hypothetical protein
MPKLALMAYEFLIWPEYQAVIYNVSAYDRVFKATDEHLVVIRDHGVGSILCVELFGFTYENIAVRILFWFQPDITNEMGKTKITIPTEV